MAKGKIFTNPLSNRAMRLSLFCVLLGLYLLVYINRPDAIDGDATLAAAVNVIQHRTPDIAVLGASEGLLPGLSRMGSFGTDGQLYSKKGVTPSLFLLPFVLIAQAAPWLTIRAAAMLFNPLVTALTAAALYTFLVDVKFSPRTAWLTALLYGAATFAITYTRTLFGEPLAALLLVLAVWQLWRQRFLGAGLALALCVGINLSYVVVLGIAGLFVILTLYWDAKARQISPWQHAYRLSLVSFLLPLLIFGGLLLAYNALRFGSPIISGYNFAQGEGFNYPAPWGIFGLWLSPYRGIIWYNPLLLLALPGAWLWWQRQVQPRWRLLFIVIIGIIGAQTLVYAAWWSWHGGIVWGARFLIPALPLLMLFVAPVIAAVFPVSAAHTASAHDSLLRKMLRWFTAGGVCVLVLISLLIQFIGSVFDYQPYVGYLYQNYASGRVDGLVSGLRDEVMLNPALSPIVGHLNRLLSGANFDTALTANSINGVHLAAALVILGLGVFHGFGARRSTLRLQRSLTLFTAISLVICLNLIIAQQAAAPNRLPAEYETLQPVNTLVVADAAIGNALLDLENGARAISMNSPTNPDDELAAGLWQVAQQSGGYLWLITWLPRLHPENWQERDLWMHHAFVQERPFLDQRAVLFDLQPTVAASQIGGWQFGAVQLARYGIAVTPDAVRVTLTWQTKTLLPQDYSWFVHLVAADGQIVAQQDRPPQGGYRMTTTWQVDEMIDDYLTFPLAAGADTAGWFLRIGWLDPNSGERLPLTLPENAPGSAADDGLLLALNT